MDENRTDLMENMLGTYALLHRYHHFIQKKIGPFGDPHRGQGRVLAILKMQPEMTQKKLSFLLNIRNQSLGELLTKLEKAGLVMRTPSQADRRVMVVQLTPEGQKAAPGPENPEMDGVFDCFTPEERSQFCEYLARLTASIRKKMESCSEGTREMRGPWMGKDGKDFDDRRFTDFFERLGGGSKDRRGPSDPENSENPGCGEG